MREIVFKPVASTCVLVVGDIILDQYIYGDTNRISPEAPVPVVRVNDTEERPGGAANVAVNVSSLELKVNLLGITGDDDASERLETMLTEAGVTCHFVREENFPTITKRRVLSQHQQLLRLDYEDELEIKDKDKLVDNYSSLLDEADIVILSDYAKGSLARIEKFIEMARQKNVPVLVDPKSNDFSCYSNASILTPNQKELEQVIGKCDSEELLFSKGEALCNSLQLDALLLTRGEKGMVLLRDGHTPVQLKAQAHEVYDVTGAGDTVIALLAAAMACDYDIESSMALANTAAGLVVEKLGAATVSVDELNSIGTTEYLSGVIDEQKASMIIDQIKQAGETLVITNGCFDILHKGHVQYLEQASVLGDYLIVLVNDDDSVKRLKGEHRPINSVQDRMDVLAALKSVDWVMSFSEDTPERLLSLIKPDVLVKGGDYSEDEVVGADLVKEYGGKVVVMSHTEGYSTSTLLEKIESLN